MLRPTFSGFQVANSALSASQRLLDVTAQNISNMNTDGYTRQRLDLYSIAHTSGTTQYAALLGGIGRGVSDSGVSQIRDSFLDIRYRTEAAKVGEQDVMKEALTDLSAVFDEVTTAGLDSQISDLVKQLQTFSNTPGDPVIEGVVKTSAQMVTELFNHYAAQLETVRDQQTSYLKDDAVDKVNSLLVGISELNQQIKYQNIHGDGALELNDKRNTLIDELSTYMNIEVVTDKEEIGNGLDVDVVSIVSNDIVNGTEKLKLVDQGKYAKLEATVNADKTVDIKLAEVIPATPPETTSFSNDDIVTSSLQKGELAGYLNFLNNKGEFTNDENYDTENRGINFFEGMLNQVASKFAEVFNTLNKTSEGVQKDLFEANGGGPITAANIKISDDWKNATGTYIVNTQEAKVEGTDNSGANDNILAMIAALDQKQSYSYKYNDGGTDKENFIFKGTIQECFSYASSTLDAQISHNNDLYKSYGDSLLTIDKSRAAISSVSIDEEGVNLLQYNKSYSAAARLMTTLDDALSTLINNTGRVGL